MEEKVKKDPEMKEKKMPEGWKDDDCYNWIQERGKSFEFFNKKKKQTKHLFNVFSCLKQLKKRIFIICINFWKMYVRLQTATVGFRKKKKF